MDIRGAVGIVGEAATAGVGVAAAGGVTTALLGQSWIVPVMQVAVSVIFIVKAIDKRLEALHKAVNVTRGEVEVLDGRVSMLACQRRPDREGCDG